MSARTVNVTVGYQGQCVAELVLPSLRFIRRHKRGSADDVLQGIEKADQARVFAVLLCRSTYEQANRVVRYQ